MNKATLFERMSLASMTEEQLRARIEALEAENAALRARAARLEKVRIFWRNFGLDILESQD